jgi:hypothetical protein
LTKTLDPEVKRLRGLPSGDLADEAGRLKAALAHIKDEAVRRDLRRAEGALFRLTMIPPGRQVRLDRKAVVDKFGAAEIAACCYEIDTDWVMRCSARKTA